MRGSFTIAAPTNAVLLDAERRGTVVFTVANHTGRPARVAMKVTPFDPAPGDWFWIEPEGNETQRVTSVERPLALDGTDTCTVRIKAPADASAGPQAFRLDVVSVDHPDEEWAQGQAIGFEIPRPVTPPPPPPPGYIETVGGALGGALGGIALGSLTGLLIALVSGVDAASSLTFGFITVFGGGLVIATALGGAIGAFAALVLRAILRPEPWQTALAFGVLALVLGTLLQLVAAVAAPRPTQAIIGTAPPQIIATAIIRTGFPVTAVPATTAPAKTAAPSPPPAAVPKPEVSPALTLVLALVGTVIAAGAARAFTRWRALGSL